MEQAINAYQKITIAPEFQEIERQRSIARHNEAAAIRNAKEMGEKEGVARGKQEEREKWQGLVAGKDAENEQLRLRIVELQTQMEKNDANN